MADAQPHCPRLDPKRWDGTEHEWTDRLFIKDSFKSVLHIPVTIRRTVKRLVHSPYSLDRDPSLVLVRYEGMSGGEVLVEAKEDSDPSFETETLTGTFYSRHWEGKYRDARDMIEVTGFEIVEEYGVTSDDILVWLATCRDCMEERDNGDIVVFGRVDDGRDV